MAELNLLVGYDLPAELPSQWEGLLPRSPDGIGSVPAVDSITLFRCLERMSGMERVLFLDRCWHALRPGGIVKGQVYAWSAEAAYADPRAVWPPISQPFFNVLIREWREAVGEDYGEMEGLEMDFEVSVQIEPDPTWSESFGLKSNEVKARDARFHPNVVQCFLFELKKKD